MIIMVHLLAFGNTKLFVLNCRDEENSVWCCINIEKEKCKDSDVFIKGRNILAICKFGYPPCKETNVRFTTVPLKPVCVRLVQRYCGCKLTKTSCIQLQLSVCSALCWVRGVRAHTAQEEQDGSISIQTHMYSTNP